MYECTSSMSGISHVEAESKSVSMLAICAIQKNGRPENYIIPACEYMRAVIRISRNAGVPVWKSMEIQKMQQHEYQPERTNENEPGRNHAR